MEKGIDILILTCVLTSLFSEVLFNLKLGIHNKALQFIISKLYCWKCLSFWFSLITVGDIYFAAKVALTAIIVEYVIVEFKEKILEKWN